MLLAERALNTTFRHQPTEQTVRSLGSAPDTTSTTSTTEENNWASSVAVYETEQPSWENRWPVARRTEGHSVARITARPSAANFNLLLSTQHATVNLAFWPRTARAFYPNRFTPDGKTASQGKKKYDLG